MSPLRSLALVQGAITLCWVIYDLVLPQLLDDAGLDLAWVRSLLVIENLLILVVEPVMGALSDRWRQALALRWSLITGSALLAATMFVALPWLAIARQSELFVGLVVLWSVSMAVFRSPVLSLLGQMGGTLPLPVAASVLTLSSGIFGALRPVAQNFLLSLGAVPTFGAGAIVLGGAILYLRRVSPAMPEAEDAPTSVPWERSLGLAAVGMAMGTGTRLLLGMVVPEQIAQILATPWVPWGVAGMILWQAGWAVVGGWVATRWGLGRSLRITAVAVGLLCGGLLVNQSLGWLIMLLVMAGFGVIANGMIPLALTVMPARWGGLGIGTYLGAFGGAIALWGVVMPTGEAVYLLSMVAFLSVAAMLYRLP
ncbi:MAG: SLC45 family MFS transporter [Oscillatoriales cyanobacterium SM2_2_1]|nr:SLC45 family MFS transporter [Oscillatoriales cyanobacterium SM2_2_1]